MRSNFVFIILSINLASCAGPLLPDVESSVESKSISTSGFAELFALKTLNLGGLKACESSIFRYREATYIAYDKGFNSTLYVAKLDPQTSTVSSARNLYNSGARFGYVATSNGTETSPPYLVVTTQNNDIYLGDGDYPYRLNLGTKILAHSTNPDDDNYLQWNAAIAGPYMAVECAKDCSNQEYVLLRLYNNTSSGWERASVGDIPKAGNPYLAYYPGRGLLMVYGSIENGYWCTRLAVLRDGSGVWDIAPREVFCIEAAQKHVCDPHLAETSTGYVVLTVSYNQKSLAMFVSKRPMQIVDMFDF
jgi:hypothetical protein